uniref:NADH-ubiquinone oxidoreductase chain 6 n=2 Tax=Neoperla arambourgana TaxID=3065828 RepID=A0AA95Z9J7_9NEOP|nr:NADH dehydrogenase subunit 6 [Neoperla arambourgana]WNH42577.1 NADH dehydrogenase subunit 6 [Neoperla arambourgana]
MSLISFFILTSILSFILTLITHPLAMGLVLLTQTLIICLTTGLMTHSFWFSYILFLVFLGGLLVLFIYVSSLASNEMFSFTPSAVIVMMSFGLMSFMIYFIIDPLSFPYYSKSTDTSNAFLPTWMDESTPALMKLYNNPTSLITLMLALYLFLTLIAVVQITKIFHGPLRQKN